MLLAVRKEDAHVFGMGGAQAGDVVYVLKPEYMAEHGYGLPPANPAAAASRTSSCSADRTSRRAIATPARAGWRTIVPTLCYMTGGPVPEDAEGAPIYQIMEDPNMVK